MATDKELMSFNIEDLIALGAEVGLTFHTGMKKSQMVQQLAASEASKWMDIDGQFNTLHEVYAKNEDEEDYSFGTSYGDSNSLSDAANIARFISKAELGYTEAFHNAMSGPTHHLEAVKSYFDSLEVNYEDVWKHMPKANPNIAPVNFGVLNAYLRDSLTKHQDMLPRIKGHYEDNFLDEYATNKGGVRQTYEYLAHIYLDKSGYNNNDAYQHDLSLVANRLEYKVGPAIHEIAAIAGMSSSRSGNKSHRVGYMDALPMVGDQDIIKGTLAPRTRVLNSYGYPLGSAGGPKDKYSLSATLTNSSGYSEASKALYKEISETLKSLSGVYKGKDGLDVRNFEKSSDYDFIMDSSTRYVDEESARSGYRNLEFDSFDKPLYRKSSIESVINNDYDVTDVESERLKISGTGERSVYSGNVTGSPQYLSIRSELLPDQDRLEELKLQIFGASGSVDTVGASGGQQLTHRILGKDSPEFSGKHNSAIQFHNFKQGTQEWHDFRNQFDITGSLVGKYLGNSPRDNSSPIKFMGEHIGLTEKTSNPYQTMLFERGHRLEAEARPRVAKQYGVNISETGAITNSNYPGMMYSPDGLIGDDAIWEHKAPNKFNDLSRTPEYIDQMQLGMLLSGRSRALYSQTVGDETRSQWIDFDPNWYPNNADKLNSIRGRMAAGREFMSQHSPEESDYISKGRAVMTGEGIWGFQKPSKFGVDENGNRTNFLYTGGKRGMSKYSPIAGTSEDPFLRYTNRPEEFDEDQLEGDVQFGEGSIDGQDYGVRVSDKSSNDKRARFFKNRKRVYSGNSYLVDDNTPKVSNFDLGSAGNDEELDGTRNFDADSVNDKTKGRKPKNRSRKYSDINLNINTPKVGNLDFGESVNEEPPSGWTGSSTAANGGTKPKNRSRKYSSGEGEDWVGGKSEKAAEKERERTERARQKAAILGEKAAERSRKNTEKADFFRKESAGRKSKLYSKSGTGKRSEYQKSMAKAVKRGILDAQEENRKTGLSAGVDPFKPKSADAEFERMMRKARYDNADYYEGGGNGGGNGGGGKGGGGFSDDFGEIGGKIAAGIAGGSVNSAKNGVLSALAMTPWGRLGVVAVGAASIANEVSEYFNDYVGSALDSGVSSPIAYSAMSQGMEMLGTSSSQAEQLNRTTHSAYNTLLNGDPSGAIQIVRGSRGLITISDIREAKGDPTKLSEIAARRAKERGWGQDRFAGAMQMSGLDGMARTYGASDENRNNANDVVETGKYYEYEEGVTSVRNLQSERVRILPSYAIPRIGISSASGVFDVGTEAIKDARKVVNATTGAVSDLASKVSSNVSNSAAYKFIAQEESGDKDYRPDGSVMTSKTGAIGRMQVLPSTAAKPGYGIRPSDGTLEDTARVGREYYDAMLRINKGDARKAMAAYTDGQGTLDKALKKSEETGVDWLTLMPEQAQNRVKHYDEWFAKSKEAQQGANNFGNSVGANAQIPTVINLNLNAQINDKQAQATVTAPNGQTTSYTVNMGNGANQRR